LSEQRTFIREEDHDMDDVETKVPVKNESNTSVSPPARRGADPFETLRRKVDRLFDDFHWPPRRWGWPSGHGADAEPFWRSMTSWGSIPAVDFVEKDQEYEITAELPGMDASNIELGFSNRKLTIRGEKKEEKEEKERDYYLSERRYGSFQRSFALPEGVDPEKIRASFENGLLRVTVPKSPEAQKQEKKIAIQTT
jgi:HSP20 family protein